MQIIRATASHLDELERLYSDVNDYLASNINYPGWVKGEYPVRETAEIALEQQSLFIGLIKGRIVGSIILNHQQEKAYYQAKWLTDAEEHETLVVHTLAVHPQFMQQGIARMLMNFARDYAITQQLKSIRLDTFTENYPAIRLYESLGYQYVDTVDLGLNLPGFVWFKLYELAL